MTHLSAVVGDNTVSLDERFNRIATRWKRTNTDYVKGTLEIGQELIAAQEEHGESVRQMAERLPFGWTTATMLMKIARTSLFTAGEQTCLPPSWRTMYELTNLPTDILEAALADGRINPNMTRDDAIALHPHGEALPGVRVNVPDGKTLSGWVRVGLELEDRENLSFEQVADRIHISRMTYRQARDVVLLADNPNLDPTDSAQCQKALMLMDEGRAIKRPHEMIKDIAVKVWGTGRLRHTATTANRLNESFEQSVNVICQACQADLTIPQLSQAKAKTLVADLTGAKEAIAKLIGRLREKVQ
jgi:hypothetical protein